MSPHNFLGVYVISNSYLCAVVFKFFESVFTSCRPTFSLFLGTLRGRLRHVKIKAFCHIPVEPSLTPSDSMA